MRWALTGITVDMHFPLAFASGQVQISIIPAGSFWSWALDVVGTLPHFALALWRNLIHSYNLFLVHQDGQTLSQTMWPKDCGCEAQMQPMSCPRPANRGPEHPAIPTTQEAWFMLGASYSKFYLRSEHLQKGFNWSHLDTSLDFSKQDPNHVQMKPHATILWIGELTLASTKTSFLLNIGHCIHARQ